MINLLLVAAAMTVGQCEGDAGTFSAGISVGVEANLPRIAPVRKTVRFFQMRKPARTFVGNVVERRPVRSFFRNRRPARRLLGFAFGRRCGR